MEEKEMSIADIVTNEEDKKVLEPVKSKKKKTIIGIVNCDQLFLREEPNKESDALDILLKDNSVIIDEDGSTATFYKVVARGVVGYCAKEFITIK